jgi:uncharacterized membrane protein YfcA
MIMKKNLLFILFLVMPIALIGISIYNKDIERIERAFYFLLSICGAYIMSSLKEAKNYKNSVRGRKKFIILSFIGALFSIFVFFLLGKHLFRLHYSLNDCYISIFSDI